MKLDSHWGRDRRKISNVPDSAVEQIRQQNDITQDATWAVRYGVTKSCIAKIRLGINRIHKYQSCE